jgi:phospholipid/cholesterol/gamma-HCH transport system substrate-binding protein
LDLRARIADERSAAFRGTTMSLLAQIFTWWNGPDARHAVLHLAQRQKGGRGRRGQRYYQTADGVRRWVIYNGASEATRIAPEWHGWLHHTWQEPPTVAPLAAQALGRSSTSRNATGHETPIGRPGSLHAAPAAGGAQGLRGLGRLTEARAMAQNDVAETIIGAVVIAAAAGFVLYAGQVSGRGAGGEGYPLTAAFRSVEGIAVGTDVRLAGIRVGAVTALELDPATFQARATFTVEEGLEIPEDSDVKIASEGLLGARSWRSRPGPRSSRWSRGRRSRTRRARWTCSTC